MGAVGIIASHVFYNHRYLAIVLHIALSSNYQLFLNPFKINNSDIKSPNITGMYVIEI